MIFSWRTNLDEREYFLVSWGCCNSPRASSAAAEAEQGSRSSAGAGSAEAGSLGAPVGSGRTSIHRDGSLIVADVGTTKECRVGGESAAVQRSRSSNVDVHSAPEPCTISFQHTVHECSDAVALNVHSSSILQ